MLTEQVGISQRLACRVVGQPRSTQRRQPRKNTPADPDADMRTWLREFAAAYPRKGYRRAWADLRAVGWAVNHKKVQRIWQEEGLQVPQRTRRKRAGASTVPYTPADAPNVVWGIDFQFDTTTHGRKIKIASMVDEHTRESLLDITEHSITSEQITTALDLVIAKRGTPAVLRCDNGPEFISQTLKNYCTGRLSISYVPPGQPWHNGYIESFNNRCRDECLNMNELTDLTEAKIVITDWKTDYNKRHRHSALNYLTPTEYAAQCKHTHPTLK